ncbi:MAG: pseudaminic acid cytidylyltransferase [Candidatus Melainabacteria bacterium]|nr:pseudaminic acid cytidylyltransferase [Candidatus Melainabacteria bacterium]
MSIIAIIPARGGSKRIPKKNIRPFNGKPIIAYSIEAALQAACFDSVVVSTDETEIADVATAYGASMPFLRSPENSNDHAGLADVALEVLERYEKEVAPVEKICLILATAPFISGEHIKAGYKALVESGMDAALPVVRFSYSPQRGFRVDDQGRASMLHPEHYASRSQDLEPVFHDCGQFYWIKKETLLKEKRFFAANTAAIELPESEVQDIDTEEDWKVAELKFELMRKLSPCSSK